MSKKHPVMKPIAFSEEQSKAVLEICDQYNYTFTAVVRDAVEYYIQNQGYIGRLDIFKDIEDD